MDQSIEQIADLYSFSTSFLKHVLRDITEDDAFARPNDKSNPIIFILGHMTSSRYAVARIMGLDEDEPWNGMFQQGQKLRERSEYPSMAEVMEKWDDISQKLSGLLAEATDEQLAAAPLFEIPGIEKSRRGNVGFLQFHESYHIGQIAYIRKELGYDGAVG